MTRRLRSVCRALSILAVAGWLVAASAASAQTCAPGTYGTYPSCFPCEAGTYSDTENASSCTQCTLGSFAAGTHNTACTPCDTGTFASSPGSSTCAACAPGTFADAPGTVLCSDCALGTFASSSGSSTCSDCAEDTFAAFEGSSACLACSCDDANVCTEDSCAATSGTCSNDAIFACGGPVPTTPIVALWLFFVSLLAAGGFALRPRIQ